MFVNREYDDIDIVATCKEMRKSKGQVSMCLLSPIHPRDTACVVPRIEPSAFKDTYYTMHAFGRMA
jgi:hypothetical protein